MHLLFVCTANIARSPYAERRLAAMLGTDESITLSSAGIPGYPGRAMDTVMAEVLTERGGTALDHVSVALDEPAVNAADIILAMSFTHHMEILSAWPHAAPKVFGLRQFASAVDGIVQEFTHPGMPTEGTAPEVLLPIAHQLARRNSMTLDVPDPYRRGTRAANKTADLIDHSLVAIRRLLNPNR